MSGGLPPGLLASDIGQRDLELEVAHCVRGVISPLLANIYLTVLDRAVEALGSRVRLIRYADDCVACVPTEAEAHAVLALIADVIGGLGLELHPDKTRLIEFGRSAQAKRTARGERGAPDTFRFLGLLHICSRSRKGRFMLTRHTDMKRMRTTLQAVKTALARRRHDPIDGQGRWLGSVVRGYFAYHAVPTNSHAIGRFRSEVIRLWCRSLRRRSQRHRLGWQRMTSIANRAASSAPRLRTAR